MGINWIVYCGITHSKWDTFFRHHSWLFTLHNRFHEFHQKVHWYMSCDFRHFITSGQLKLHFVYDLLHWWSVHSFQIGHDNYQFGNFLSCKPEVLHLTRTINTYRLYFWKYKCFYLFSSVLHDPFFFLPSFFSPKKNWDSSQFFFFPSSVFKNWDSSQLVGW
jgi:hypothetical protein